MGSTDPAAAAAARAAWAVAASASDSLGAPVCPHGAHGPSRLTPDHGGRRRASDHNGRLGGRRAPQDLGGGNRCTVGCRSADW
eukprot:1323110-Prymnesium_polylepis.1